MEIQSPSKAVITSVGGATKGGTSDSSKPLITGTADAGTTVNIYDGARFIGTATVAENGTWSFTAPVVSEGWQPLVLGHRREQHRKLRHSVRRDAREYSVEHAGCSGQADRQRHDGRRGSPRRMFSLPTHPG